MTPTVLALADQIEDALPQTQCTKCGFAGCRPYAEAIASSRADINQCPPGGAEGIARLAKIVGKKIIPLNPINGTERPRSVAIIEEALCIGCTLCIQACPVDAIVGAAKQMHTVLATDCTGCDLCVPVCPVDCIVMEVVTPGVTGWAAWSQPAADAARVRHDFRIARLTKEKQANDARLAAKAATKLNALNSEAQLASPIEQAERARKQAILSAAIARAKQRQDEQNNPPAKPPEDPT
jgi:electron transport complex protein RnfB